MFLLNNYSLMQRSGVKLSEDTEVNYFVRWEKEFHLKLYSKTQAPVVWYLASKNESGLFWSNGPDWSLVSSTFSFLEFCSLKSKALEKNVTAVTPVNPGSLRFLPQLTSGRLWFSWCWKQPRNQSVRILRATSLFSMFNQVVFLP